MIASIAITVWLFCALSIVLFLTRDKQIKPTTKDLIFIRDQIIVAQHRIVNDPGLLLSLIELEEKVNESLESRGYQ